MDCGVRREQRMSRESEVKGGAWPSAAGQAQIPNLDLSTHRQRRENQREFEPKGGNAHL